MLAKYNRFIIIAVLLVYNSLLFAQVDPEIQSVYQAELPVVFNGIQAYGLESSQKLVLSAMEDAFLMRIVTIDEHFLSGVEKEYLIKDTAREEKKRLLNLIHSETNALSLALIKETLDINARIQKERYLEKLRRLYTDFSTDQLDVPPEQLPLKIVETVPEKGIALYMDVSVRNVEGYFHVSLELRGAGQVETSVFVMAPDELDFFAGKCADIVAPFLMGIEPASIVVNTLENASVYLNSAFSGRGDVEMLYLYPGKYTVLVDAVGFKRQRSSVILGQGENRIVALEPTALDVREIEIQGEDAEVFVDGEYIGQTPLVLSVHEEMFLAELREEGSVDLRLYLNVFEGESYKPVFISLEDWQREEIEIKRNEFYTSFGVFVFSLAAPIVLNGLLENTKIEYAMIESYYSGIIPQEINDEYLMWGNIWYYSYYASIGLSGGIFTWAMFDLFEYMDVYKKYNGI